MDGGVFFGDDAAIFGFPQAKKDKRNCGRGDVELGFASDFCFGFPAEELRGKKQSEDEPDGEREENDQKCRGTDVVDNGAFEAMNEIGGGKKKRGAGRRWRET